MPLSAKQRRWAWTPAGRKALGEAKAKEWQHTTDAEIAQEKRRKAAAGRMVRRRRHK